MSHMITLSESMLSVCKDAISFEVGYDAGVDDMFQDLTQN